MLFFQFTGISSAGLTSDTGEGTEILTIHAATCCGSWWWRSWRLMATLFHHSESYGQHVLRVTKKLDGWSNIASMPAGEEQSWSFQSSIRCTREANPNCLKVVFAERGIQGTGSNSTDNPTISYINPWPNDAAEARRQAMTWERLAFEPSSSFPVWCSFDSAAAEGHTQVREPTARKPTKPGFIIHHPLE